MAETTETKPTTLVTERLHFVKRGLQLWGFTEQYGAILGTHEAMVAKMSGLARTSAILEGHKGVESYLQGFDGAAAARWRLHPTFPALLVSGDTTVARVSVEIVEAMASNGIKGRETPPIGAPYWRARDAYSAAWFVVDGEPIGLVLPMIPMSKGQA